MNPSSKPRPHKLLIEPLESRILYSAAPVSTVDFDTAPPVEPFHEAAAMVAEGTESAAADPVSISEALGMVGSIVRPWGFIDKAGKSELGPSETVASAEPPPRDYFFAGAPAPKVFVEDLDRPGIGKVSGPEEELVLLSSPESDGFTLATAPVQSRIDFDGVEPGFSLASSEAPARVVLSMPAG